MPQIVNKKSVLEMAMGAITEITDYEVERVVANIMDPNTAATAKRKITITLTFAPDDYRQQIGIPSPVRYSVDTLEALVKLIRTEGVAQASLLYVRVDSARRVVVDSTYTGRDYAQYSRLPLYEAVSDVPSISVNQYMSQEHAVIELQSLYAVTDDRDYLLALLSRIDVNQGVSSVDNGISQEVSVKTGAVLKEQQTVQPIVHLQPYRTFLEVEQPASDFLLRLDKEGRPALYDECVAWMGRYCAAKHAAPRLREKLAEETRRAEYAEVLRKAPAGTAETNLESAIASINARREKLAAQLTAGEAAQVEIEEAIGKVPDALEREVLQARYIDGRTNRQIAARMRVSERYVRKLHRRGILQILKLVPLSSAQV